jgi:hypothetical protein
LYNIDEIIKEVKQEQDKKIKTLLKEKCGFTNQRLRELGFEPTEEELNPFNAQFYEP